MLVAASGILLCKIPSSHQRKLDSKSTLLRLIFLKRSQRLASMIKIMSLIIGGIFLMGMGAYALSISNIQLTWPQVQWPDVDWALVGFVTIIGGLISTGTGIAVSRLA